MIYSENWEHIIVRQHLCVLLLVRLSHSDSRSHYIRWLLYTLSAIHAHRRSGAEQQSHKLSYGSH